jgi:hypothetical protein
MKSNAHVSGAGKKSPSFFWLYFSFASHSIPATKIIKSGSLTAAMVIAF